MRRRFALSSGRAARQMVAAIDGAARRARRAPLRKRTVAREKRDSYDGSVMVRPPPAALQGSAQGCSAVRSRVLSFGLFSTSRGLAAGWVKATQS